MPEEGPRLRLLLGAKEASEISAWPKPTKVIPLGRHTDTLRVSEDQVNAEARPPVACRNLEVRGSLREGPLS